MADLVAVCQQCQRPFRASHVIGGHAATITMTNVQVGPCPFCGGMGRVPDGIYELFNDAIKTFRALKVNTTDLQQLKEILQAAEVSGSTPEQAASEVEQSKPEFGPVADWVRRHPQISLLLTILTIILGQQRTPATDVDVTVNVQTPSVEEVINQLPMEGEKAGEPDRTPAVSSKVGRNEPCPCLASGY